MTEETQMFCRRYENTSFLCVLEAHEQNPLHHSEVAQGILFMGAGMPLVFRIFVKEPEFNPD